MTLEMVGQSRHTGAVSAAMANELGIQHRNFFYVLKVGMDSCLLLLAVCVAVCVCVAVTANNGCLVVYAAAAWLVTSTVVLVLRAGAARRMEAVVCCVHLPVFILGGQLQWVGWLLPANPLSWMRLQHAMQSGRGGGHGRAQCLLDGADVAA